MKHSEIIALDAIERIQLVIGNGRTAPKVKQDTGADHVINFGFYDMFTGKPTHHLKIDGNILAQETWGCWGYAWDTGPDIKLVSIPCPQAENYVAGFEVITPMTDDIGLRYDPKGQLAGSRGRTAVGLNDKALIFHCANEGDRLTLEALQTVMYGLGAKSAVFGDGGGSAQGIGPNWEVPSSDVPARAVYVYMCIWLKKTTPAPKVLYKVQVGAYSVKANAERLRDELAGKGYTGFITEVQT